LRLYLLTDKYLPHMGGSTRFYHEWCTRLADTHEVCVITRTYSGAEQFDAALNYKVVRLPYIDIPKLRMPLLWLFIFVRTTWELLRAPRGSTMLLAGQILETGAGAWILSRLFRVPYLVNTFAEEINLYARWGWTRRWMRRVLTGSAAVTSISRYTAARIRELGLYERPIELVVPAVDITRFTGAGRAEVRQRLGLAQDVPVICTVGRLLKRKGHDTVLAALPRVLEQVPEAVYLVVGKGSEEARLRAQVQHLGLEASVIFQGAVDDGELEGFYSAGDVFVHPNREVDGDIEGFGLVFLEANACGVPVIGGDSGGAPDAIDHGVSGLLVDPTSVEAVAGALLELLQDGEKRQRMGEAGREWAGKFSWDHAAAQVNTLVTRAATYRRA
jgi:phosphatidyl-myo-inositol dimannoside synthase